MILPIKNPPSFLVIFDEGFINCCLFFVMIIQVIFNRRSLIDSPLSLFDAEPGSFEDFDILLGYWF